MMASDIVNTWFLWHGAYPADFPKKRSQGTHRHAGQTQGLKKIVSEGDAKKLWIRYREDKKSVFNSWRLSKGNEAKQHRFVNRSLGPKPGKAS